jgi:hypothetical protein
VTGRREGRHKLLFDDLKEKRGYWKLKEDALDRPLWRTGFGRGCWTLRKADYRMSGDCIDNSFCTHLLKKQQPNLGLELHFFINFCCYHQYILLYVMHKMYTCKIIRILYS